MKVSELTADIIISFSKIDDDAPDKSLIDTLFLPAAKEYVRSHIGIKAEEMDNHEDLPIAVCALCAHMYDNRSVEISSDKVNKVVSDIINRYDNNLIPKGGSV